MPRQLGLPLLGLMLAGSLLLLHAPAHAQTQPPTATAPQTQSPASAQAHSKTPAKPLPKGVRSITLSAAELNAALGQRFPLQRKLQGLLNLRLSQPSVQLLPEFNRLQTGLQLAVSEPFTGSTHEGHVQLQHRLRYEASDRSLRLADIEVTALDFPQVPEPYRSLLRSHAPALLEQTLPQLPLYTAQAKDTALLDGLGFAIGQIDVTAKGLRVALHPPSALPESGH